MANLRLTAAGKPRLRNGKAALFTPGAASAAPTARTALSTAMIGQSNMVHLSDETSSAGTNGTIHYYITDRRAQRWTGAGWDYIGRSDPTGRIPVGTPYATWNVSPYAGGLYGSPYTKSGQGQGGDGISIFVNQVTAAANIQLRTYEYAVSGSSIQRWQTGGDCWTGFYNAVTASGQAIDSTIYLQGEDNANTSTSKTAYKGYLRTLHDQLLALAGLDRTTALQFYFGIGILGPGTTYAPEGAMGVIRAAQLEYIAENTGAYLAAVVTDADLAGDAIHFNNQSEARMGARYAKSLALWAKGTPAKSPGPKIIGATASNGGLTVTVATSGGVGALKDGAGGSGGSLLGARFFKADGTPITTTASVISGSNIVFTLASAGVATMDYGMANAPYGSTTAPASVVYDSDTVPGDTTGLPLQPCAAITVT